jgi:hypothetical protein
MEHQVYSSLAPVRTRQRWQFAVRIAIYGLLCSAAAGIGLGLWRVMFGPSVSLPTTVGVLLAGPLLGAAIGLACRRSWQSAAAAVDMHYRLKDRALTALEFLKNPQDSEFHRLQVVDAAEHLCRVDAAQVVPLRMPRVFPYALASLALAVVLGVWPHQFQLEAGVPEPIPGILAVADGIDEDLDELEQAAEEQQNEELKALVEELRAEVEAMREADVDVREALAKISEMQAAIAAQQAQYNEAVVDAQLQALGAAMMAADGLKGAGRELQEGQFDKAAQELENLELVPLERREAKAVADRMKKVARSMNEAGLGQLSESVSDAADGIESGNSGKAGQGARRLAQAVRSHNTRRKINDLLSSQLTKLSESKALCQACQAGACSKCGGNCQGGQCQGEGEGNKNSLAEGMKPERSTSPKNTFGKTTSGNVFGDQTSLASTRNMQEITGQQGDGPSDIETTNSPEGREEAQRQYREVYQKYQKLSEAVLDSEPIPLGQRQTIRRYFELIRPQEADGQLAPDDDAAN